MPAASAMTTLQCPIESSNTCLSMLDEAVYVTQLSIAVSSSQFLLSIFKIAFIEF